MSESQLLEQELARTEVEPLLPVEKKLIGWSLGLGVGLLAALALLNRLFSLF
jgi:hypothetical protein